MIGGLREDQRLAALAIGAVIAVVLVRIVLFITRDSGPGWPQGGP